MPPVNTLLSFWFAKKSLSFKKKCVCDLMGCKIFRHYKSKCSKMSKRISLSFGPLVMSGGWSAVFSRQSTCTEYWWWVEGDQLCVPDKVLVLSTGDKWRVISCVFQTQYMYWVLVMSGGWSVVCSRQSTCTEYWWWVEGDQLCVPDKVLVLSTG